MPDSQSVMTIFAPPSQYMILTCETSKAPMRSGQNLLLDLHLFHTFDTK
jgi:hypothetical protein